MAASKSVTVYRRGN